MMQFKSPLYIGLDVGSVSVNAVVLDDECNFLFDNYTRTHGRPLEAVSSVLSEIEQSFSRLQLRTMAVTGSGADLAIRVFGGRKINEVVAQAQGTMHYYPQIRTIIEMGGEDSKLIILKNGALVDFSMNSLCAAGTGSFLDQQAGRLKIDIETEFGQLAMKSNRPPRIAGRCSVFAKSDMIHLQQIATPDYDIVAGLCFAMARNFKGTVARGRVLEKPVGFQGGVAANAGMVRAIREVFALQDEELIIPQRYASMGAAGAAISIKLSGQDGFVFPNLKNVLIKPPEVSREDSHPPLDFKYPAKKYYNLTRASDRDIGVDAGYLGVDVGSLSTNVVVIDSENRVLAREYLMTEGRPLDAVCRGLKLIEEKLGDNFKIRAAGTTGSGRYLTADFIGADLVKNEITCQATAGIAIDPKVDTIFEIGGQDSKYISIKDGVVVDFEMNKACAAGTGSFLQEQAEKLDISINDEFAKLSFESKCPVGCGERCTVFMESDLVSHQQAGAEKKDLVAGLAYSIVYNYLNKVVGDRRVGNKVFFQGGVAWNKAVVAAFEEVTGKEIIVPPHHDVTGAIGAAIMAREYMEGKPSGFKGFGIHSKKYTLSSFTCEDCPNSCHIHKIEREGDSDLYYGSRCEKYESGNKPELVEIDTVAARNKIMFRAAGKLAKGIKRIAIPLALSNWELYPFWAKFFAELGHKVVVSGKTNRNIIHQGCDLVASETCFPVKVAHGHITAIDSEKCDFIFLPSMITMPGITDDKSSKRYTCPYVQSLPYIFKAAVHGIDSNLRQKIISPDIEFHLGEKIVAKRLYPLGKRLGNTNRQVKIAVEKALNSYISYRNLLEEEGRKFLNNLPQGRKALVIVGRPYNVCDYGANMELPDKIRQLGVPFIPMDFLPPGAENDADPGMYWNYGQKIIAAAQFIKSHPQLYAVYLTNFGCGPDSFITHQFRTIMDDKPYLQLEIDEHSADAGFITRIEAFLDRLKNPAESALIKKNANSETRADFSKSKIYIPNMCDHAHALAAVFRYCGLEAEVLPQPDDESLNDGRRFTSGRECFPAILTTGDLVRLVKRKDFDRSRAAFFMPTANGPCRFGQYHTLHRKVLDELGFGDVPVYSPSSSDSYSKFVAGEGNFRKMAWIALVATDILIKMLHHSRPYEIKEGSAQAVYTQGMDELCESIEAGKDALLALEKAASGFVGIRDGSQRRPLVGVVGEIYIRNNIFSNSNLIMKLEKLGCETYLATFGEWVLYTTFMYGLSSRYAHDLRGMLKSKLQEYLQYSQEHQLSKVLELFPDILSEKPVDRILELGEEYLSVNVGGESILSVGKGLDLIQSGAAGVINTLPFTCMPGNVVTALSKSIREDYPGFPWLNLSYEGLEDTGESIRLEAFVHQVREYHHRISHQ
ncbi:MAG: CoA activase [candidate division Zixibacteria bacterium CG_4_9_14_3_um_filter_46_8]|nr:MAG: CoA activase [candidate division Zixibacteria bacterium CG_4_9_14_3_um_filter_46_8]